MLIAVKNVVMHTVMIALLSECQVATIKTYSSCFFLKIFPLFSARKVT